MTHEALKSDSTIAIVGAGAVGSYYGGRLAAHGADVHFLLRSDYAAVRQLGLTVQSPGGDFYLPPMDLHVYDDAARMPKADLVIVALKTTANEVFGPLISPLLKADTAIVTLQNGLGNEEQLAGLFGAERIMGCMVYNCINRDSPGHIRHVAHGINRVGELTGGLTPRAGRVAEMFSASNLPCEPIANLIASRWEKLAWNIPLNALSVLLDQSVDQLLSSDMGVRLFRQITVEVLAIGRQLGFTLSDTLVDQHVERSLQAGAYRTSMQIDRNMHRQLEVEAILGEPLRAVERIELQAPNMQMLYMLVKMLDSQIRRA